MSRKDYYATLGVSPDASQDDVKAAYRRLAKEYHPDRNAGDETAERRFKEVGEAYEVLGDPEKRRKYDELRRLGAAGAGAGIDLESLFGGGRGGGGGGGGGFGGLGDIFSSIFGGRGDAFRESQARPQRGEDVDLRVEIPFETAAFGGRVSVRLSREDTCGRCGGAGSEPGSTVETCPVCRGTGSATQAQDGFAFHRPCPRCFGKGKLIRQPCRDCGGQGRVETDRTIEVTIPKGIADGKRIRLRGEGEMGVAGGPRGDAYVRVKVRPHAEFERKGLDIHSTVSVNVVQAALGTEREIPTIGGTVTLRIPAGVQPGQQLRLRDQGVEDGKGRRGDHLVTVRVHIPKELGAESRERLRAFGESAGLDL
jgi:molecular chaperone DnaJ